jgi:uncharacterized membrane protein
MESRFLTDAGSRKKLVADVVHQVFRVTLLVKAFNGVIEVTISSLLFLFGRETINNAVIFLVGRSTASLSDHFPAYYITSQADRFSQAKYFLAAYFLFYGVVNIFLVIFLLKGRLWAYPVAIIATSLFILYLLYRFYLYHSSLLLFFTVIDVLLVVLTWFEYRRIRTAGQEALDIVKN